MNILKTITAAIMGILFSLILQSCVTGKYLRTEQAPDSEITGNYTLILYGGNYSEDIENVAILDKEGDPYTFEVFAREYDYTVKKDVPAKEALDAARKFISSHRSVRGTKLNRVIDKEGNTIGYELRPLYFQLEYGYPDILHTEYVEKDHKIIVRVWLREEFERREEPFLFRRM
jgi:hypothetical protein